MNTGLSKYIIHGAIQVCRTTKKCQMKIINAQTAKSFNLNIINYGKAIIIYLVV